MQYFSKVFCIDRHVHNSLGNSCLKMLVPYLSIVLFEVYNELILYLLVLCVSYKEGIPVTLIVLIKKNVSEKVFYNKLWTKHLPSPSCLSSQMLIWSSKHPQVDVTWTHDCILWGFIELNRTYHWNIHK